MIMGFSIDFYGFIDTLLGNNWEPSGTSENTNIVLIGNNWQHDQPEIQRVEYL